MKKLTIIINLFLFFSTCFKSYGQEINEDELFSDFDLVIESTNIVTDKNLTEDTNSFDLSGDATSIINFTDRRSGSEGVANTFSSSILGDIFLDGRLKRGTKYFADIETKYDPQTKESDFSLKEIFIDFNIKKKIYFRTGKQVLQWGRSFLWNPTDLINIEKKTFLRKIGTREGAYGIKFHIPFGVKYNIYSFLDTGDAVEANKIAAALKFEFLLKNTEMAFALWHKINQIPVYAYDFSTRFFGFDTIGEFAISHGDNTQKIKLDQGTLTTFQEKDKWISRASIGFGKSFEFMDVSDRISFHFEFYYNSGGYEENIFNDNAIYAFNNPLKVPESTSIVSIGTKKDFLLLNNLYELNNFSKYYAALFTSFNRFIITDLTFTLNLINNANDGSSILTTGFSYKDFHNFNIALDLYTYLGKTDHEYTFLNNTLTAQLTVNVLF